MSNPTGALLVGSVPLASSDSVFRTTSAALGRHLRRMPDGETGVRTYWMVFQLALLARNPAFRAPLGKAVLPFLRAYARLPWLRRVAIAGFLQSPRPGASAARLRGTHAGGGRGNRA